VRFAFTDDQLALRDALRDLLTKECTPAHVRAAWGNDTGRVPGLWEQLADMGVLGLLASEADGGLGLTFVDLVLALEESGRHAVPEPIVETAAWGVPLLGRSDLTIAAGRPWVPWADSADVIFTADGRYEPDRVELIRHESVDGARRLFEVRGTPEPDSAPEAEVLAAFDRAACGIAAQQPGAGDVSRRPSCARAPTNASGTGAGRTRSCSRWRRGTGARPGPRHEPRHRP
jgi:hypothetical protein